MCGVPLALLPARCCAHVHRPAGTTRHLPPQCASRRRTRAWPGSTLSTATVRASSGVAGPAVGGKEATRKPACTPGTPCNAGPPPAAPLGHAWRCLPLPARRRSHRGAAPPPAGHLLRRHHRQREALLGLIRCGRRCCAGCGVVPSVAARSRHAGAACGAAAAPWPSTPSAATPPLAPPLAQSNPVRVQARVPAAPGRHHRLRGQAHRHRVHGEPRRRQQRRRRHHRHQRH